MPASRPLLSVKTGAAGSSSRLIPSRNARVCCVGTACTMYWTPASAAAAAVYAFTFAGRAIPCR